MYRDFQRQESEGFLNAHKYEPDVEAALSLLKYMSREQLDEYLNSTDKLDAIIADLPQIKGMKRDRENSLVKNRSLAEYNMSLQPKFESLKREVATAYEEVNTMKLSLGKDVAKLESCSGNQSQDTMIAICQTEAATTDEESEELAEKLLDAQLDIETFINVYLPKRTAAYTQKAKLDKLTELLRHGEPTSSMPYHSQSAAQNSSMKPYSSQGGGYNTSPGYGSSSTPYPPTQGYGMPTPFYPR